MHHPHAPLRLVSSPSSANPIRGLPINCLVFCEYCSLFDAVAAGKSQHLAKPHPLRRPDPLHPAPLPLPLPLAELRALPHQVQPLPPPPHAARRPAHRYVPRHSGSYDLPSCFDRKKSPFEDRASHFLLEAVRKKQQMCIFKSSLTRFNNISSPVPGPASYKSIPPNPVSSARTRSTGPPSPKYSSSGKIWWSC